MTEALGVGCLSLMDAEKYWAEFVGDETPEAFMRRMGGRDLDACVAEHMRQLPHMFGLVLRRTWRATFSAEEQLTRERVRCGLAAHLENTRASWEPTLAESAAEQGEPEAQASEAPQDEVQSQACETAQDEVQAQGTEQNATQ